MYECAFNPITIANKICICVDDANEHYKYINLLSKPMLFGGIIVKPQTQDIYDLIGSIVCGEILNTDIFELFVRLTSICSVVIVDLFVLDFLRQNSNDHYLGNVVAPTKWNIINHDGVEMDVIVELETFSGSIWELPYN